MDDIVASKFRKERINFKYVGKWARLNCRRALKLLMQNETKGGNFKSISINFPRRAVWWVGLKVSRRSRAAMGNNSSLGCRLVSTLRSRERNRSSEALQWSLINTFTWSRAYYWPHLLASWSTSSSPSLEFISRANSVEKTKQSESCRHFWDLSKLEIVIERLEREWESGIWKRKVRIYL